MKERKLYCVKYKNIYTPYFGFIRPYNAVADSKTFSLTYIPPSMISGIEDALGISGRIVRHKLKFNKNHRNTFEMEHVEYFYQYEREKRKIKIGKYYTIHNKHKLYNPELILAFETKEDAEIASRTPIYFGQTEYIIKPYYVFNIYDDNDIMTDIIDYNEHRDSDNLTVGILYDNDFDKLPGVETFEVNPDDPDAIYCGNNRQRDNKRMYIKIHRNEWYD